MNLLTQNIINIVRRFVPIVVIGTMLVACSDNILTPLDEQVDNGDTFTLDVTLNVAEINTARSRAFSTTPAYGDLKLYMVEFEGGGETPLDNGYIKQISTITDEAVNTTDGDIHFKVTLDKADQPRILHLIAVPKDEDFEIPYGLGLEGTIIPGLTVGGDTPAYWQRIEFEKGYGHYIKKNDDDTDFTWETFEEVKTKLTHVPMICNFAKVSLISTALGFNLEGFALLNRPEKGTVAAYNSENNVFPQLNNGATMLSYSTIDAYYEGYSPTTKVTNTNPETETYSTDAKFLYERKHSSLNNPPVVIMKGNRGGESMYYKIDLGYKDDINNLFHFYDILRNFEYAITVTEVGADGYTSAQEALDGVVFNNFSFDVQTKQLLSVSDGKAMLQVNNTTFVVTSPDSTEISLYYKYENLPGSASPKNNTNIEFLDESTGMKNDAITGDAITSLKISTVDEQNGAYSGWRKVTIKTPVPSADRKSQEIVMFDPATGLGRLITIIVRLPWQFIDPGVWGGTYYYLNQYQNGWLGFVSNSSTVGQPLTVRFRIYDDIPEAMFPLRFTFESSNQNIQNDYIDNLVVSTGQSLFQNVSTNVIKYVKTISWANYNTYKSEAQNGIIELGDDGLAHHYITAHFLTILPITTATTTIRVQNPYMSPTPTIENPPHYVDVTFTGRSGTAPVYTYTAGN